MTLKGEQQSILVVDGCADSVATINAILQSEYRVQKALDGLNAVDAASQTPQPDLILLGIKTPKMDGYGVISWLKSNHLTEQIPVMMLTDKSCTVDQEKALAMGAVDYISKPFSAPVVLARIKTQLALARQNLELNQKLSELTQQLNHKYMTIMHRLGKAGEFKDDESAMHIIRMSHYSRIIAESMNISGEFAELIFSAAPMHDIGMISLPDKILQNPDKLTSEERKTMQRHTEFGHKIIGEHKSEVLTLAADIAITHHEKWDGTGYPGGVVGKDIPLAGRIVAIADVFDGLTSDKPYKRAWPVGDAVEMIADKAGFYFDPELVPLFQERLPDILEIKQKYRDFSVDEVEEHITLGLPEVE